jgi:fucose permease
MDTTTSQKKTQSRLGLILIAYIAFISLGLPDGLLGVAWPSMRGFFGLPLDALGMLLFASTTGYLTSSFLSGRVISRLGVGGVLAISCALTGSGLIGYTLAPAWWILVAIGVFVGFGAGAIDAGINTFVASNFNEGMMQWLHASYGIGVTLSPIIMTTGLNIFHNWRWGYTVVGITQLSLAVCFFLTISMWQRAGRQLDSESDNSENDNTVSETESNKILTDYHTALGETLRQPAVWLSLAIFFLYTGLELVLGSWAYTLLTESRGIAPQIAGLWAGSYWGMFTVGRMLAGLYTKRIGVHTLVRGSLTGALIGALLVWWNPSNTVSLIGVGLIGFAIAPVFPGLVSGTRDRVGARFAANTIGMQIGAAGLGGAVIPALAGALAQRTSLEVIPIYLFVIIALDLVLYNISVPRKQMKAA